MNQSGRSCIIIGAGISGLCTAFWLKKAGFEVTVLERDEIPGGAMKTIRREGFLIDTGPNSALETTPLFDELFDGLGILGERVYANEKSNKRYILRGGVLHPLPMSPGLFLKTKLWSTRGKLRLLKEPLIGKADHEESVAQFVERRLGREFLDYAINPFVAGVYAGNPEELSVRSAFPKLYRLEEKYGGLIKGMIRGRKERKKRAEQSKQNARMFSFREGMGTFPLSIAATLGDALVPSTEVVRIRKENGTYAVDAQCGGKSVGFRAPHLVIAVPAYHAASLLTEMHAQFAGMLKTIYYPPVALIFLAYARSHIRRPLDGFGYLIPARENRKILGTIWSSTIFPDRAPEGSEAFTTFIGGSRQPELLGMTDEELLAVADREVRELVSIGGDPKFRYIRRWNRAIPQYKLGYAGVIRDIEMFEDRHPGLFLCANYRGGIAVGDCVMSARRTADAVLKLAGSKESS